MKEMTDNAYEILGQKIARLLGLKRHGVKANPRFDTAWGDKTFIGLAKSVQRLIDDYTAPAPELTPELTPDADPRYPEHEKLSSISKERFAVCEFLDWLANEGYEITKSDNQDESPSNSQLLAKHFGIDLKAVEKEKKAMLAEMRKITLPTISGVGEIRVFAGAPTKQNPYLEGALSGPSRKAALNALRDGDTATSCDFTFWHCPPSGGARQIKSKTEVAWH